NVFENLGLKLGIPARATQLQSSNPELERRYASLMLDRVQKPDHKVLTQLAKEVGLEVRQVQRWLRKQGGGHRLTRMDKFCECG
ncbi:unnamed protein product, partial [Allacma fusca]